MGHLTTVSKPLLLFYICVILVGISARWVRMAQRTVLFHDEAVSYLSATGHQGEFALVFKNQAYPLNNWVPAEEWKRFIQAEKWFAFNQIASDLARFDLHPPLYFWVLHLWTLIFGTNILTGLLLNVSIDLVILFVLMRFALIYLQNLSEALLVACAWILSPVSVATSDWIRHYVLFTLFFLLFAYLLYKFIYLPEQVKIMSGSGLWLAAITTGGLLTHYNFVLAILIGIIIVGIKCLRGNAMRLVTLVIWLSMGGFLFLLIYPDSYLQLLRYGQGSQGSPGDWGELNYRLRRTISTGTLLFSPFFLILAVVAWNFLLTHKISNPKEVRAKFFACIKKYKEQPLNLYILGWTILTTGIVILLYLASISPQHAMASRYVSFISPYVALISILTARLFQLNSRHHVLFCTLMLILGIGTAWGPSLRDSDDNNANQVELTGWNLVVVDNLYKPFILSVANYLPGQTEVFVAGQNYLIDHNRDWLPRLSKEGGGYIATSSQGATAKQREDILSLISQDNKGVSQLGTVWKQNEIGVNVKIYQVGP